MAERPSDVTPKNAFLQERLTLKYGFVENYSRKEKYYW